MCRIVCDGHCSPASSSTGPVEVGGGLTRAAWWLASHVVGPALLISAVVTLRWLSGAPLIPDSRPWRRPRWVARIRWHAWPRWQRAVTRIAVTLVAIAGLTWPLATAVALTVAVAATVGAAAYVRRRQVAPSRPPVRAIAVRRAQPALEAQPIPATILNAVRSSERA